MIFSPRLIPAAILWGIIALTFAMTPHVFLSPSSAALLPLILGTYAITQKRSFIKYTVPTYALGFVLSGLAGFITIGIFGYTPAAVGATWVAGFGISSALGFVVLHRNK